MFHADILVVGGGVVGLTTAWRLAQGGYKVTLLERGRCGSGASMASLGALMPYNPGVNHALAQAQRHSLWQYPQFAQNLFHETGIDIKYRRIGRINPITSAHQLEIAQKNVEHAYKDWPRVGQQPAQEILSTAEAENLEPEVVFGPYGALHCRVTGFVCPHHLISALRAACQKSGVQLFENTEVFKIEEQGGKAVRVQTSLGPFSFDKLVVAAGAWSKQLLPEVPVEPLRGHALFLRADNWILNRLIRASGLYIAQIDSHTIVVGASKDKDAGFDDKIDEYIVDNLMEKAEKIVPSLAEFQIEKKWIGFRPASSIKHPVLAQSDTLNNATVLSGHAGIGICLTPFMYEQALGMVINGIFPDVSM